MNDMNQILYALILVFGTASYAVGLRQMIKGKYAPSVFSRVVWLLLAINSFAGVVISHSSSASVLLAGIFLVGNAAICIASFWKGTRHIGSLEYLCLVLLGLSAVVWIVFSAPLINLALSLVAHFIGALPTYKRVLQKPSSESVGFWSLFFIASVLSVIASWGDPLKLIIFPIYFAFFDGSMTFLSMRHRGSPPPA